jgi:hypothetical protein
MAIRKRLDQLEDQINRLHSERMLSSLDDWIKQQDTPTLERLRLQLEEQENIAYSKASGD